MNLQEFKILILIILNLETYYLSLGTNLGNRIVNLQNAIKALIEINIKPISFSAIYETSYVGTTGAQPDYLNAAIGVKFPLTIVESGCCSLTKIVDIILKIEDMLGRQKNNRAAARIIDIDLLLCGKIVSKEKKAIIPHPRLHERLFVLTPLHEIAGKQNHPVLNKTIEEIYFECLKRSKEKIKIFAPAFKLQKS